MLIRLDARAKPESVKYEPCVGDKFFKYFFDEVYDKGDITEVSPTCVVVDFGDTIKRFPRSVCTLVFNAGHHTHLMTCDEGELIRDFRSIVITESGFDGLEDLMDFDKWMV